MCIESQGVHDLKVHLEQLSSLVPSQLYPDLIWWNYAIMPGVPKRFGCKVNV